MNPNRSPRTFVLLALTLALSVAGCSRQLANQRDHEEGIQLALLKAPPGYTVSVFAQDLPKARQMALGDRGTLFVGSRDGKVYALTLNGDQVARKRTVASGITDPAGIAFGNGALFVSARTKILRFDNVEQDLDRPPAPVTIIEGFPDKERHGSHIMGFGPDSKLYISVGSPCNVCEPKADEYGTILRVNADGTGREVFARGIRNTVGFDWHPKTGELWFTDNGQDEIGLDRPDDELNRVARAGEHFGFPYCHGKGIADPQFGAKRACSEFTPPAFGLGAHVAALGMAFYAGERVPQQYQGSILVARHGSHPPIRVGYDVVRVVMRDNRAESMEPFLTGFLQGRKFWGRPVDVLVLADASVLIADDLNGAIYRVAPAR